MQNLRSTDLSLTTELPSNGAQPLTHKFGPYGGQFVPETLMPALAELEAAYLEIGLSAEFQEHMAYLQQTYVGRPTR